MDKKDGKKNGLCLTIGFWSMLVLFVALFVLSILKLQLASLIILALFVVSVFFVFVMSVKTLAPEGKSMAYIALGIAILFILYLLIAITIVTLTGTPP